MHPELSEFATRLRSLVRSTPASGAEGAGTDKTDAWAARFTATEFNRLARELFALQVAHNEVYRRVVIARGITPSQVSDWREIPALPTAAFKEFAVTSLLPAERTHEFQSSGTTGRQPGRHFHCAESLALYEASLWAWFARHLVPEGSAVAFRLTVLTPPVRAAPCSSLVHMFDTVRRRLTESGRLKATGESGFLVRAASDGSWVLDWDRAQVYLDDAAWGTVPVLLLGTAFSFVHLLDRMHASGRQWKLPPGSRAMETGGYKGRAQALPPAQLHAGMTERLGIPPTHIVCEYGMCELSSQAYDRVAGTPTTDGARGPCVFRFPPWSRAWVVSPETGWEVAEGETGLLRVCDLANVASVLAIQTEDLAVRRGDGFELVGRAQAAEPRGCSLRMSEDQLK